MLSAVPVADTNFMTKNSIDLNADLGENCGDDIAMLSLVSSANVACGGHAGGGEVLEDTIRMAAAMGVRVAAHPSYSDRDNFGRKSRLGDISRESLVDSLVLQIVSAGDAAERRGIELGYVKPHGALYNDAADIPEAASLVVEAVARASALLANLKENDTPRIIPIMGMPNSCIEKAARDSGILFFPEAFADRAYLSNGRLVPRSQRGALVDNIDDVVRQVLQIVQSGTVTSVDGEEVPLPAVSICLHGDTPGAVDMARAVRTALSDAGITIAAGN